MGLPALAEPPQLIDLEQWRRSRGDLTEPDLNQWRKIRGAKFAACLAQTPALDQWNNPVVDKYGKPVLESWDRFRDQCASDIVYWVKMTCWGKDPRRPPGKQIVPLIPWEFQEKLLRYIADLILYAAHHDYAKFNLVIEKARDMAGTVTVLLVFQWLWQFHGMSFIVGSRDKPSVDSKNNLDTPFGKLRFNIEKQPYALLPKGFDKTDREQYKTAHIGNDEVGIITGEAPGENFGRKSRAIAALFDEFAFWTDAPKASWGACFETVRIRIAVSTPNGPNNYYASLVKRLEDEDRILITLYWWLHPAKSKGLRWIGGKPTSDWYEEQKRKGNKRELAKEVDLDYNESTEGWIFHMYLGQHRFRELLPDENATLWRSWDLGDTSCVLFCQSDRFNRALFLKELIVEGYTITEIADMVADITNTLFYGLRVADIGDPQGWHNNTTNKIIRGDTEYSRLKREKQIIIESKFFADIPTQLRTYESIDTLIGKMEEQNRQTGTAGLLVDNENCPTLDAAFREMYRWATDKNGKVIEGNFGNKLYEPNHPYEDVVDAARIFAIKHYYFGSNRYPKGGQQQGQKPVGVKKIHSQGGQRRA